MMIAGVLYESVYAAYGLFHFVDFTKKFSYVRAEQGDTVVSSICFLGLENNMYLLITRSGQPNWFKGKPVKRRR